MGYLARSKGNVLVKTVFVMETTSSALAAREKLNSVRDFGCESPISSAPCGDIEAMRSVVVDTLKVEVCASNRDEDRIGSPLKIAYKSRHYLMDKKKSFLALPHKIQRLFLNSVNLRDDVIFDNVNRLKLGLEPHDFCAISDVVEHYHEDGFVSTDNFSDAKELKNLTLSKNAKKNKKNFRAVLKKNKNILERKEQLKKDMKLKNRREIDELMGEMSFLQMEKKSTAQSKNKMRTEAGLFPANVLVQGHFSELAPKERMEWMRCNEYPEEKIREILGTDYSPPIVGGESSFLDFILNHLGIGIKYLKRLSPFSNFVIYVYQLTRSSTAIDIGLATWQFFSTIDGVDITQVTPYIKKIIEDCKEWLCDLLLKGEALHTEALSDTLEGYGASLLRMVGGQVFQALRQILIVATGLKFFPKDFAMNIYDTFGKGEKVTLLSAIEILFSQFLVLLRFGEGLAKGISLDKMLEVDNPTEDFFKRSKQHLHFADKTYQGMPVPDAMDHMSFIAGCTELIILGTKILSLAHPFSRWKKMLTEEVLKLKTAKFQAEKLMNATRPAPICFTISGPPGIGKAKLVTFIGKQHCLAKGREFTAGMIYNRTIGDKFVSNYNPASQPIWHYAELGVETAAQAKLKMSEIMSEFLCVADSLPYAVPMAAIPDKGTTFVRCDLVIADTNNELLNLVESVWDPSAQLRRIINIQPFVMRQFRRKDSMAIDEEKSLGDEGRFLLDKFVFQVKVYVPSGNKKFTTKYLMAGTERDDIFALTLLLQKLFRKHIEGQDRLKAIDESETAEMYLNEAVLRGNFPVEGDDIVPVEEKDGIVPDEGPLPVESGYGDFDNHVGDVFQFESDGEDSYDDLTPLPELTDDDIPDLVEEIVPADNIWGHVDVPPGAVWEDLPRRELNYARRIFRYSNTAFHYKYDPYTDLMSDDEGRYLKGSPVERVLDVESGPIHFRSEIEPPSMTYSDYLFNSIDWGVQFGVSAVAASVGFLGVGLSVLGGNDQRKMTWLEWFVLALLCFFVYKTHLAFLFLPILFCVYLYIMRSAYFAEYFRLRVKQEAWYVVRENIEHIKFLFDRTMKKDVFSSTFWRRNAEWLSPLQNKATAAALVGLASYSIYKMAKPAKVKKAVKRYPLNRDENGDTDEESCPCYDHKMDYKTHQFCGIHAEAHSDFANVSSVKDKINEFEDAMACGLVRRKIPTKENPTLYNVKHEFPVVMPHKGTCEELINSISTNIRRIGIRDKLGSYALGLKQDLFLVNSHALVGDYPILIRVCNVGRVDISVADGDKYGSYAPVWITEKDVCHIGNDQSVVRIRGQQVRDITHHISVDDFDLEKYTGHFFGEPRRVKLLRGKTELVDPLNNSYFVHSIFKYNLPGHKQGDCGIPLVIKKNSGVCIAGFHAAGKGEFGYSVLFDRDRIEYGISRVESTAVLMPIHSEAGPFLSKKLTMPIQKSAFCHETFHGLKYFGKFEGKVNANLSSKLKKSLFSDTFFYGVGSMMGFDYTNRFGQPVMSPIRVNGEYISPINLTMRKMTQARAPLDHELLGRIADELSAHIIDGLRAKGVTTMNPATMIEAVNGAIKNGEIEDASFRRINASTSGGHDFEGPKKGYLPLVNETTREPNSQVCESIVRILDHYSKGETAGVIYAGQYKDEARELSKVAAGKTRVFYMSPLDNLIVSRMVLMPLQNAIVNHGDVFCTGIGLAMHRDAAFIEKLINFSSLFIEGDYGNYDLSMPFGIGLCVNTIILNIFKAFGYNAAALKMTTGLLTDLLFPYITFFKDLYQAAGLQVSGKFMTAEDNSLRGLVMLMYAFYSLITDGKKFFDYILPVLYGDDVLAAVKEEIKALFNNNTYKKFCEEVFRMPFTSASKSDLMEDFVTIDTCTFLKRSFRYREDLHQWVAPLDMNSIFKSMRWVMPSVNESEENQMRSTLDSALWELSLHLSKDKHDAVRTLLEEEYSRLYVLGEPVSFPKFDDIIGRIFGVSPDA